MNENINFDDFRPFIPQTAPDLAQLALEQADDKHGPTLQRLLEQVGTYLSDCPDWSKLSEAIMNTAAAWSDEAAKLAASLVADACQNRYEPGC